MESYEDWCVMQCTGAVVVFSILQIDCANHVTCRRSSPGTSSEFSLLLVHPIFGRLTPRLLRKVVPHWFSCLQKMHDPMGKVVKNIVIV